MTGSPRRPTPKALAGRQDPALRVTPVDYRAVPRPPAVDSRDRGSDRGDRGDDSGPGQPSGRLPPPRSRGRPRSRPRTVELPRPAPAAPADAVHTLDAEDPRPRPRPLRLDAGELRTVGVEQVIDEQVVHTVADPEDAWTADAGNSDHFLRGELVVQVRRTDNAVIGVFSARYALSVRPEDHQPALDIAETAAGPGVRGGRGTRHPTTRRELLRRMEEAGFVVTAGSTHGRVSHPDHPGLFVPFASTPSDRRFTRHAVAQIRRVFGIDLRR
ncbi:MAG TPA: hypothetical protein H9786_00820 [Candidatus Brachybacterium merdavium]|uniref:Uncharacterized protein n=1 Tax=Candidatus Brachybacterium merdavium TaxID=2838513 RepID=A0A9D2RMA0_9MICO|nr:hypothetical protein [Candidatus Brachybacterium merdavium]